MSEVIERSTVLTCAPERLAAFRPEFEDMILQAHWAEVGWHRDDAPLTLNWPLYETCDANGSLVIIVLRADGEMAGYWAGFVAALPHYATTKVVTADAYFILPAWRARGALRLFRTLRRWAAENGVKRIFSRAKLTNGAGRVHEAMGYRAHEIGYVLDLP